MGDSWLSATPGYGTSFASRDEAAVTDKPTYWREITAGVAAGVGRVVVLCSRWSLKDPAKEGLPAGTRGFQEHPGVSIPGGEEGRTWRRNTGGVFLGQAWRKLKWLPRIPLARTQASSISTGCWEV